MIIEQHIVKHLDMRWNMINIRYECFKIYYAKYITYVDLLNINIYLYIFTYIHTCLVFSEFQLNIFKTSLRQCKAITSTFFRAFIFIFMIIA